MLTSLKNEMRTAKQQAQDLEQTNNFLNALLSTDRKEGMLPPTQGENTSSRMVNGKPRLPKIDPISRFSDPPAPPPQQPLPEKPDLARSSPSDTSLISSSKRSETTRPGSGISGSPTNQQSSQILSLVEALGSAKKELDSQGARVKHLEDMLRQERSAREGAEERARRLEQSASFKPTLDVEPVSSHSHASEPVSPDSSIETPSVQTNMQEATRDGPLMNGVLSSEEVLQSQLSQMVAEMDTMKQEMKKFQQRAEAAEANATSTKESLAEMIKRLREQNEDVSGADQEELSPGGTHFQASTKSRKLGYDGAISSSTQSLSKNHSNMPNGHLRTPPRLPENLERVVASVLRTDSDGQLLAQSAPYASMLGVVLIGVGLMAYLNSWQKLEK